METNEDIRSAKTKFMALGWYFMMKYFMFLLRVPMNYSPWTVAPSYTAVVSVVPGKKAPYVFDFYNTSKGATGGVTVRSLVYFVPGTGRLANGISAITHGGKVQLGVCSDSSYWPEDQHHQRFIKIFEQVFEKTVELL